MRPARIGLPSALATLGAVVLLVSLFLSWYEPGLSAWTVFETLDLVLAGAAIASIGAAAADSGLASPVRSHWLPRLAVLAFVLVVAALINHPPLALGHPPTTGIWVALTGSLLMLVGGLLTFARVSLAVNVVVGRTDPDRAPPPPRPRGASTPAPPTAATTDIAGARTDPVDRSALPPRGPATSRSPEDPPRTEDNSPPTDL